MSGMFFSETQCNVTLYNWKKCSSLSHRNSLATGLWPYEKLNSVPRCLNCDQKRGKSKEKETRKNKDKEKNSESRQWRFCRAAVKIGFQFLYLSHTHRKTFGNSHRIPTEFPPTPPTQWTPKSSILIPHTSRVFVFFAVSLTLYKLTLCAVVFVVRCRR